jgi:hypothetical protein
MSDLANPTSRKIETEDRYPRFADAEEHEFGP